MSYGTRRGVASRTGLAMVALLAACSGPAIPTPEHSATPEPLPTARTTVYPMSVTAWYAGLMVRFDAATAVLDPGGGSVVVTLRLENPGPDLAALEAPILLVSGAGSFEPSRETVLPDVAAGGTEPVTLLFEVDAAFDPATGAVHIGRPAEHQVIVPIQAGAREPVTLEPRSFLPTGKAQAGNLLITLRAAELRADLPDWGLQLPLGSLALTVTYDAAYRGDGAGGFPFTAANIALILPDGRTIPARADGHSAPAVVIAPRSVVTGLRSRFEVPVPGSGSYRLVVIDGTATKTIELTIGDP